MAVVPTQSPRCFDGLQLEEIISKGSLDFDEWTSLISDVEKTYPDDMEKICLIYDHFLSNFPLCYGYWRKYAAHMTRLCTIDKVVEVFEKAVSAATYSLGVWVDYCTFSMSAFEDPSDIRRLFNRALSFVGKDYLCHTLWDKYIHFEFSQQQWVSLAHIYVQTLKFPTKKLHQYYDSFRKLLTLLEGSIASLDTDNSSKELQAEPCFDGEIPICCKGEKIYCIIKDMMDSSAGLARSIALKKYRIIGEQLYRSACELDSKISFFEANIQRHYFHVRPLDASQLQNWHDYLDFIELQEDFDWAVKLYERCLIPCANYPEYWMRYVDFMETKGGREIANYCLDRATEIYLKRVPEIHLFNARFKEQIGDVLAARAAYIQSGNETDSGFVENVISKANMEKRLGNTESACSIYKEAIEMAAATEKLHVLPILYVHYSRLKYMSSNNADAARDILISGIKSLPENKLLLEELIKFSMMNGGPVPMAVIDSIIAQAISPRPDGSHVLGAEDAESISNLYLEFVDYCGTIHDIRKARNRHTKLFRESARTDLHQLSAMCRRSLNLVKDKKHDTSVAMPNEPSRDSSSDLHASLHPQDKKMLSQKYDVSVTEEPRDNDPENNVSSADLVEVKEESTKVPNHFKTNYSESDVSSETLLHQTASGNQPSQALQASSKEDDDYSQGKYELEPKELKPLSPTSTSTNRLESTFPDSGPMVSQEEEDAIPQGFKLKTRAVIGGHTASQDNSARTQDSESAQIHVEKNSSSYSRFHQDHRARRPLPSPRSSRNAGGNLHPMRNTGKLRRGTKYGHRGNTHRKQQHQQQLSPPQIHPAEGGAQLPVTPGYPSQSVLQIQPGQNQFQAITTPADFVAAQSWPIQNIQMPNSSSQSQPLANTPSQVSQYAMQGNGQYGYMQNGQEYNQMWQYYYYQQQQQLQLQQHYAQLQQQSFQQEESQQLQQQNPLEHLQPQQLQQFQHVLLQQQQQRYQQQQPQQQEHPVHVQQLQPSTLGGSNPVADQGPPIATSQDQGSISSQQACEPGTVPPPLVPHPGETSTQE